MRRSTIARAVQLATLFALAAALPACVTREVRVPVATPSSVAPALIVEQFMRAVNSNDIDAMLRLWGTRDGPVPARQRPSFERRMVAVASILRHQDYEFEGDQIVPGRRDEAVQIMVRVTTTRQTAVVPFTMVQGRGGNWLVEQIGIDRLTNTRTSPRPAPQDR
jgi:hypothetical protein